MAKSIDDVVEAILAQNELLSRLLGQQEKETSQAQGRAVGGAGASPAEGRSSSEPAEKKSKQGDLDKFINSAGRSFIAEATSPVSSPNAAATNLALGASSALIGDSLTQGLLNVSGVGQQLQAGQNAEAQTRAFFGAGARAGLEFSDKDISEFFNETKAVEQRDQKVQEQIGKVIGGEQSSALIDAVTKGIENGFKNVQTLGSIIKAQGVRGLFGGE